MFPSVDDIKELTVPWLLQDIRKNRKSGSIVFEQDAATIKVFLKQGDILFASSNIDDDTMREFLLHTGKITQGQLDKASALMAKTGKKFSAVLFELGAVSPQDLVAQTKLQAKQNILALFSWRKGRYRFEDGLLSGAGIIPLQMNTDELIFEGVRSLDWQEIRTSLPPLNTIIRKVVDPSPLFHRTNLTQDENKVISLINGNSSIQEICNLSGIGDLKTLTACYVLMALRMAETGEVKNQEVKEVMFQEEREALATKEQKPSDPTAAEESLITKEMLQNAYDSLDIQDYYEILGIGRSATRQEIRNAYVGLSKLYHPDRYTGPEFADMRPKLKTLFENINEAYQILSVKEKHDQYNLDLASGTKRYQEKQELPDKQETNKAAAEVQFNEGMKQYRVQNFWGAEEAFRWALRLDPSNPEYIYYQGLALAHMPRRRHEAEEYFLKAIALAPSKLEYYLELGNFYIKNGLKTKALAVYQNALKIDPKSEKLKQAMKAVK